MSRTIIKTLSLGEDSDGVIASGGPIDNADLWKRYIAVSCNPSIRVDVFWVKGKKSPILKKVDRAAKAAGKTPLRVDRGFRGGKVGRSKVKGGSSSLFEASGQIAVIHIYRSQTIRKEHHRIFFDLFDPVCGQFNHKCRAYVIESIARRPAQASLLPS
jgi:hypothetical protein